MVMESTGKDHESSDDVIEPAIPSDKNEGDTMASVSTWLSGWYNTAKQKVVETNEFMKRDLQEFTQAVQIDASKLAAATATTMKEKLHINVDLEEASTTTRSVTNTLSNFLGNFANKLGPIRPDDDENADESAILGTSSGTKMLSPSEARIHAIRTDPATFCNEPDSEEEYFMWLPSLNVEDKKSEISTLMLDCSQIRSLYTKLVPSAVSHSDFWGRYFFKIHQHVKSEERRAMLMERASSSHNDIEWDDEDDDNAQTRNIKDVQTKPNSELSCHDSPKDSDISDHTKKNTRTEICFDVDDSSVLEDEKLSSAHSTEIAHDNITEDPNNELCSPHTDLSVSSSENVIQEEKPKSADIAVKTPSTGESSDDWEKDFDLDMTEDEIQEALKESEAIDVNDDDIADDWDAWE